MKKLTQDWNLTFTLGNRNIEPAMDGHNHSRFLGFIATEFSLIRDLIMNEGSTRIPRRLGNI